MNAALVPVKALAAGKSRLAAALDRAQVEALTLAMLQDVLEAMGGVSRIDRCVVVTPDAGVAAAAQAVGAEALLRDDPGLNAALDRAARELGERGLEALLVVLGDVAGARSEDLARLFAALDELGGRGVVLAPSRDGGTAALLRAPHDAIPSLFGPESAAAHRRAAARAGVPFRELPLASLAVDVDDLDDARALLAARLGAKRTRALLAGIRAGGDA